MDYYRPQTKFAKVMFSQVCVCPQGGVCHTPQTRGRHSPGQTPPGQTPPGKIPLPSAFWDTHPSAQCILGYTPTPAQCMLGYSQQVGGTHPTGMQAEFWLFFELIFSNNTRHWINLVHISTFANYSTCDISFIDSVITQKIKFSSIKNVYKFTLI